LEASQPSLLVGLPHAIPLDALEPFHTRLDGTQPCLLYAAWILERSASTSLEKTVSGFVFQPADLGMPPKFSQWRKHQDTAIDRGLSSESRFVVQNMPTGCHAAGQLILMHDGTTKRVQDIVVGDQLMGPDSKSRTVLSLCSGRDQMVRVVPVKGKSWVVNSNHVLTLVCTNEDAIPRRKNGKCIDISISEYREQSAWFKHLHKLKRCMVEFPATGMHDMELEPYFLGALLGDGSFINSVSLSKPDPEMLELAREQALKFGLRLRIDQGDSYYFSGPRGPSGRNPIIQALRRLELYGLRGCDKFVPRTYLTSHRPVRLAMLAGLLDTDGHLESNCYDFISCSERLASDVAFLARSCGFAAYETEAEKFCQTGAGGIYYRVSISGDLARVPCRIPRKQAADREQKKDVLRTGFSLVDEGEGEYYGFTLDGDGRYLLGDFTVTHNTGKSPNYMAQAALTGRTCVLTSTKGLQTQLLNDFSSMGLVDIRGRANYQCKMSSGMTCEDGAHAKCPHQKSSNCAYHCALQKALDAPMVVTNYTYWMLIHLFGEGLGNFDFLVLDESHNSESEVCSVMSTFFSIEDVYRTLNAAFPADNSGIDVWRRWALALLPRAVRKRDDMERAIKERGGTITLRDIRYFGQLKRLCSSLETVAHSKGSWESEAQLKGGYRLDPLWAADYAEPLLFRGIKKVLLTSATVIPKTLAMLGIEDGEYDYQEYPSVFPPSSSPLIYVPTIRVTWQTFKTPAIVDLWLHRIDQLIEDRLDRKGIIHTVSYGRKDLVVERSRFAEYMISHRTSDAIDQADYFRSSSPPAILLSPSMGTGYDFPGEQCEFQIICKVPYPDKRSRVMAARCDSKTGDPDYGPYITAQQLVQSCGRGMRSKEDRCENLVIDDNIRGFLASNRERVTKGGHSLLPGWFLKLYRRSDSLPIPPPKLRGGKA
jgi:Rad3-related DNA helicase